MSSNYFTDIIKSIINKDLDKINSFINLCYGGIEIDIHEDDEVLFYLCCASGYFEIIKQLIDLGENHGYGRINIHANNEYIFVRCSQNNYIEIAKYILDLGENHGYGRINIHTGDNLHIIKEAAFLWSCYNGNLEICRFLSELNVDFYGRIDIHALDANGDDSLQLACRSGNIELVMWLLDLSENQEYGQFDIYSNKENYFISSCQSGLDMAKFWIDLCENHGYGKIDIHAQKEKAFIVSCACGDLELVKWLVDLECRQYGKINIRISDRYAHKICLKYGHDELLTYLNSL